MTNSYFLQRFALRRNKSFHRSFHRFFGLLVVLLFAGSGVMWGATILSNDCSSATSGWTFTNTNATQVIQQSTTYWLLETNPKDVIISSPIDVSSYTNLVLSFQLATYGTGTANSTLVEYSVDNGSTWSTTTFTSAIPSSSTYIASGNFNIGTLNTSTLKIRFTNAGSTGKGVRLDNILLLGNPAGLTPPALTADATSNNVDNYIDIPFTDDATWRAAITTVKIDGTALTPTTDYVLTSGNLQLKPSGLNTLLTTLGSKTVSIEATGYSTASVIQQINAGTPTKLGIKTQPAAPASNGAVLATQPAVYIQDQYGNTTASTADVTATVGGGTWTLGGTPTVTASAGTATFSGLTATSSAAVTGATITFTSGSLTGITSGTFDIPGLTPTITVVNVTLSGFIYPQGTGPSTEKTFSVFGLNLTNDISIAATTNYEISTGTGASFAATNPIKLPQSGGTVASTTIYVRLKAGLTQATYNGEVIDITSNGANSAIVTCSGSVTSPAVLNAPVATAATDINAAGFTANWGATAGATGYDVNVFTKIGGGTATETESFNDITPDVTGKLITSATYLTGWSASSQSTTRQIYTTTGNYGTKSPSFALTITGDYIETKTYSNPITSFSFWAKDQKGAVTSTSTTLIEGFNGTAWSTISTLSNADAVTAGTKTYDLISLGKTDIIKIRMIFTKTDGNLSIDDITVTYGGSVNSPISGSPFTVTSATSKAVSGLNLNTEYFYTVVAKNATESSAASNEINVTTRQITFTGTGDWTDTSRWNIGSVPTSSADVVIDGAATVGSNVEINGVTVNSGKSLSVNADKQLTIDGAFTNNGTFTLQSGATVITNGTVSGSGVNNVNQALTYRTWYMSSPVASASPAGMLRIKSYNEQTDLWAIDNSTMVVGKGYSVTPPNDGTNNILFTGGALNTGEKTITLDRKGSTAQAGFNPVGNPYPSYIDWKAMVTKNTAVLETGTMWYRTKIDATTYKYFTVDALGNVAPANTAVTAFIPPMQAFWVKAKTDGTALYFENDMRSHAGTVANPSPNPLKAPPAQTTELPLLRLQVSNGTNVDEAVIYSYASATNGYDFYDSPKMSNNDVTIPEIYTTLNNQPMVINVMNSLPLDTEIGLAFVPGDATSFSLKASEITNLPSDVKVILKDYANNGTETDLTDGVTVYNFAPATISGDRFSVVFRSAGIISAVDTNTNNGIAVYSTKNGITVTLNSELNENASVQVFNAVGQQLVNQHLTNRTTTVNGNFNPGVYVVKVSNGTVATATQKIVIK